MRNSKSDSSTPKASTAQNEKVSKNTEKSGGKKLKQARLPFKLIAPSTSTSGMKSPCLLAAVDNGREGIKDSSVDIRKRKLSYDTEDDMNIDLGEDAENVEILTAAAKKKKIPSISGNDMTEVVSLVDDYHNEEEPESNNDIANASILPSKNDLETIKRPKSTAKGKQRKGAGTPRAGSSQQEKNGSALKLQIKLPLGGGKKKRRKSSIKNYTLKNFEEAEQALSSSAQELSSDGNEEITTVSNPSKRQKLNTEVDNESIKTQTHIKLGVAFQEKEIETVIVGSESDAVPENRPNEALQSAKKLCDEQEYKKTKSNENMGNAKKMESNYCTKTRSKKSVANIKTKSATEKSSDHKIFEVLDSSDDHNEKQKEDTEELEQSVLSDNDNEADDETDNLNGKSVNKPTKVGEHSILKSQNFEQTQKGGNGTGITKKVLTPKQTKLMEQRKKAREEKERKLQEEKLKKQQEKEEKELTRKREREEKEEQKRKEREEKEDQKRKEREEKERKRTSELEAKNEEKRKKNEAKEEELRKKEEERKRKEQEKEEAELKKKKAAQAFTKFFVAKTPNTTQPKNDEDSNTGDGNKLLAFRPFQIKGDMKLAPATRKNFTNEAKLILDTLLGCEKNAKDQEGQCKDNELMQSQPLRLPQLYLSELRSGKILPGKWRRASTESKDDVIIVEDELERVGQEIVEEIPAEVREEMRAKFYKFHDNRRPPYKGTWRKKSSIVKPRKPFAQDKKFFDYEIDSDDEWEEEEPGESLEDGSDEDKEKESEDDDYEVDNEWFVPHGHLSDEEMQNEDEFGLGDDNTREAQKVKLQLLQQEFAQEMKKKTEKIKPRLIGCIWVDLNGNQPPGCAKMLWDTLEKKSMLFVDAPFVEEPEVDRQSEANSPSASSYGNAEKASDKLKPISLTDKMTKDLTRLLHGNNHSKNFLINEYIAYVEKTDESIKNGDFRKPAKSVIRDKIDELAEWQVVDANETNVESNDKKKKKVKRRLCWVVRPEILAKLDLSSLKLQNSWQYILTPKFVKPEKTTKIEETSTSALTVESNKTSLEKSETKTVLMSKEKSEKSRNTTDPAPDNASTGTSSNKTKLNTSTTTTTPKEKKRVPLLISVARGQQISTPAKNKLISQFLQQKNNKDNVKPIPPTISSPISTQQSRSTAVISPIIEDDDVMILD